MRAVKPYSTLSTKQQAKAVPQDRFMTNFVLLVLAHIAAYLFYIVA